MATQGEEEAISARGTWGRLILLGVMLTAVGVFYASGLWQYFTWESVREHRDAWIGWADAHRWQALGGFLVVYILITGLSLPIAWVMTVLAGALFGFWTGAILVSFASTLGATLALLSCRFIVRDLARRRFGQWLDRIDAGVARDGAAYVILLRLTPLIPYAAINAALALTALPVRTFWWASQLGMLPVTLLYLYIGTVLGEIATPAEVISPLLIGGFVLMAFLPLALARGLRRARPSGSGLPIR